MEEQQNVSQPNWTTWWNDACYTGIPWLSAPHCLQQFQAGAGSTLTAQPLSLTQDSNGTARPGSVPSPQSPLSPIISQVPVGPTRDVTGNAMPATFADAATQLSFAEFL